MRHRCWILLSNLFLAVLAQGAEVRPDVKTAAPAVWVMESPYGFETTVNSLRDAIVSSNARMIREQRWDDGLESGGTTTREVILFFCNFDYVNLAIKLDKRVGVLLPFRITVVEQGDRVSVMAINPEAVVQQMHNPRLDGFRTRTASMYGRIIEEGLF